MPGKDMRESGGRALSCCRNNASQRSPRKTAGVGGQQPREQGGWAALGWGRGADQVLFADGPEHHPLPSKLGLRQPKAPASLGAAPAQTPLSFLAWEAGRAFEKAWDCLLSLCPSHRLASRRPLSHACFPRGPGNAGASRPQPGVRISLSSPPGRSNSALSHPHLKRAELCPRLCPCARSSRPFFRSSSSTLHG